MESITWSDFERVDLRVGRILTVENFPEAEKPAYKLTIDLGEVGVKRSSAQITVLYSKEELIGKQVLCVVNFPPKRIGPFVSEVLTCGFYRSDVLAVPDHQVPNGAKLG